MDARQNFYNHNRLLFRFLVGATAAFVGVVTLLWWQGRTEPPVPHEDVSPLRHFSAEAAMAEVTRDYAYDAVYIHDFESYPALKQLLSVPGLAHELGAETLAERLDEVRTALADGSAFNRDHVYHTSYYIGNLLVQPSLSLHALLTDHAVPYTALVLHTALKDLRSGVIKTEEHYDVAPPSWYIASTSPVFYPTPSFPSLVVSEAVLTFYILATVDPAHARSYEQSAVAFASQVFTTGAHFRIDIEYAIKFAHAYFTTMQSIPEYQELFRKAAAEWPAESSKEPIAQGQVPAFRFPLPDFPVRSQFSATTTYRASRLQANDEQLTGQLRLSLVDTRLPQLRLMLYSYDIVKGGQVLPTSLDLTPRLQPLLSSSLGYAQYVSDGTYLFLSGDLLETKPNQYTFTPQRPFWRAHAGVVSPRGENAALTEPPVLSASGLEFLYTVKSGTEEEVHLAAVEPTSQEVTRIAPGRSPSFLTPREVVYVHSGITYVYDRTTSQSVPVEGVAKLEAEDSLRYYEDQGVLLVTRVSGTSGVLVPESRVQVYRIDRTDGKYDALLLTEVLLTDAVIGGAAVSPGGRYVAIALAEGIEGHRSRVLLYDIISGIIKAEIDLASFATHPLRIDGWTLF